MDDLNDPVAYARAKSLLPPGSVLVIPKQAQTLGAGGVIESRYAASLRALVSAMFIVVIDHESFTVIKSVTPRQLGLPEPISGLSVTLEGLYDEAIRVSAKRRAEDSANLQSLADAA